MSLLSLLLIATRTVSSYMQLPCCVQKKLFPVAPRPPPSSLALKIFLLTPSLLQQFMSLGLGGGGEDVLFKAKYL